MRWLFYISVASFLFVPLLVAAQSTSAGPVPAIDNAFVQKEFGENCVVNPAAAPFAADLNGDGIEDVVIPARCKDPMLEADEYKYTVQDPYNTFFGFGDPKITTQFNAGDPDKRNLTMLIIHGVGPEAWHASGPKPKFLLVNLPYEKISIRRVTIKKKRFMAIYAQEVDSIQSTSYVYWDGKRYRYVPVGVDMQ